MKGIVIYDTSYGNSRVIAEAISETLKQSGIENDTFYVKSVKKLKANDYDFLVLGSPTKFGTMSFVVKGFLGKVKSEVWTNKPFTAFDTENPENIERIFWLHRIRVLTECRQCCFDGIGCWLRKFAEALFPAFASIGIVSSLALNIKISYLHVYNLGTKSPCEHQS
jgi:hypothetical protein